MKTEFESAQGTSDPVPDELQAIERFEHTRWPDGVRCIRCQATRIHAFDRFTSQGVLRRCYQCYGCRYQFSPVTGTAFEGSRLTMATVLKAIEVACRRQYRTVNGFSAEVGVPYRTGWLLLRRIKAAIRADHNFCARFAVPSAFPNT